LRDTNEIECNEGGQIFNADPTRPVHHNEAKSDHSV